MAEEIDQKLFNKIITFGEFLLDSGYVKAWFSWIEWCTLAAVLFVVADKSASLLVQAVATLSTVVLVIVGLSAVNREIKELIKRDLDISGWWYLSLLIPLFGTPAVVITIVGSIVKALGD